jgi:outer membrane lipoprotein carrier protein
MKSAMMRLSTRILRPCLIWIACLAQADALSAQTDLAGAISALQRRYSAVETMRAEFQQIYRAPGVVQTESGVMYMKKPGLMRWEYQVPEVKLFVADGRYTYLYTPADRQVMIQRFTVEDLRSTPVQLLLGQGDIRRDYDVSRETRDKGSGGIVLRLTPRAGSREYDFIILECDPATYDLRRIMIRERTGNTSEFTFRDLQTNVKVDAGKFQFKIPKGVEVVRLDEK